LRSDTLNFKCFIQKAVNVLIGIKKFKHPIRRARSSPPSFARLYIPQSLNIPYVARGRRKMSYHDMTTEPPSKRQKFRDNRMWTAANTRWLSFDDGTKLNISRHTFERCLTLRDTMPDENEVWTEGLHAVIHIPTTFSPMMFKAAFEACELTTNDVQIGGVKITYDMWQNGFVEHQTPEYIIEFLRCISYLNMQDILQGLRMKLQRDCPDLLQKLLQLTGGQHLIEDAKKAEEAAKLQVVVAKSELDNRDTTADVLADWCDQDTDDEDNPRVLKGVNQLRLERIHANAQTKLAALVQRREALEAARSDTVDDEDIYMLLSTPV